MIKNQVSCFCDTVYVHIVRINMKYQLIGPQVLCYLSIHIGLCMDLVIHFTRT